MNALYALTGLLVGVLVGLTGMGGGSLMTPALILIAGIRPTVAVGSDLAYSAVMKFVGAFQHRRAGNVDATLAIRLAIGSIPGGLLGVGCLHFMEMRLGDGAQMMVSRLLGAVLVLVAALTLAQSLGILSGRGRFVQGERTRSSLRWCVPIGALLGFLVGATSVGTGTLFAVALMNVFGLSPKKTVGTDIQHAALLTSALALANASTGHVNAYLVGNLLLGAIPGVILGSRLAVRMPDRVIRPCMAGVLFLCGLRMI
ncbi:MAG: sulfite exporter TauE/SafE family protein [Chthonomonadales bacterium]